MVCLTLQKLIHSEECHRVVFSSEEKNFFFLPSLKLKLAKGKRISVRTEDNLMSRININGTLMMYVYPVPGMKLQNLNSPEHSQTLLFVRISGGFIQMQIPGPHPRALESEVLEWNPKTCISKKFPGNLMLLVPG